MKDTLTPQDIDRSGLEPQKFVMTNGQTLYYFPDRGTELVKLDFIFNAGTVLQDKKMQSASAIQLLTEGTSKHTAQQIAEFMDYRGIVVEKSNDAVSATITVYTLSRYLDELLPMLYEIITEPVYDEKEFMVYIGKRKQELLTHMQQTSFVARNEFYASLYGDNHPLGTFATPEDIDLLNVADVSAFHKLYHSPESMTIVAAGNVTDKDLKSIENIFAQKKYVAPADIVLPQPMGTCGARVNGFLPNAVQTTLRIGRLLPYNWNDVDYSKFMVLNTLLGGYFGSRLMSSIREDKGYTYGIYSQTHVSKGSITFFIVSDVGADVAEMALKDIRVELDKLSSELVSADELDLVRNCMLGDFMRSIDGIFERSERFCQMLTNGITESFTDNYFDVLTPESPHAITPEKIQSLAAKIFAPEEMTVVTVGRKD